MSPNPISLVLPLVLVPALGSMPHSDAVDRIQRETVAMGTRLVLTVDAPSRGEAIRAAGAAVGAVESLEALLSTWDDGSELSRVNSSRLGRIEIPLSPVDHLLARAEAWSRRTGRAFDPSVGALIDAWDLRGSGRRPDAGSLAQALASSGTAAFEVDPVTGAVIRFREGAWLDSGGFGKGAALEAAGVALREMGIRSAMVDLGGQVLALGSSPADPAGWTISVAHPVHRHRAVASLRLRDVSVATSGASERGVTIGGERIGHILDPRTGLPVRPWGSVTVVSADPLEADVLATALFVMGPDEALTWAREAAPLAVLILEEDGTELRARWSPEMERWMTTVPRKTVDRPNRPRPTGKTSAAGS